MRSFQAYSGLWPLCARVASAGPGGGGAAVSVCRRFRLSSFPSAVVSVCRRASDDDRAERSGIGRSGLVWRESPSSVCGVVDVRVGVARLGWGGGCAARDAWLVRAEVAGGGGAAGVEAASSDVLERLASRINDRKYRTKN